MKDSNHINQHGFLETDGHKIYWEDWGNPKATPIFFMHGGPGGGCDEQAKLIFDPQKHRVIFHDQRGSGRSTPFASTENNTTHDLVSDIEKLRIHLKIEKMYVTGGSWGSALTLFYTLAHPDRVIKFVLWGLFLARQFEVDFVNEGMPRYFFPDAWERFISLVPEDHRKKGDDVMRYYAERMQSSDESTSRKYANEWSLWELTLCSIKYDATALEKMVWEDRSILATSILETHYLLNKCFVKENYILDNLAKINHIPCILAQGRFDMCTPAISAFDFSKVYGDKLKLIWVNSGHMSTDPGMAETLKDSIKNFFV